jgi:UDP-N-acetylglucosamine diphosphorylase / glucose-1-phosphate thymidylyltransferase / UDP-N-acetylgalactosamine diphosphorylase / glucosamine-1-phosphate N-acetyltransferase / galactosamine-1-phosphate N-acetyltransferase
MQAVILAAGRGTRMKQLTDTLPKPLLEVAGKTLMEHKFDALPPSVTDIVIVVGYQGDAIKAKFGNEYKGALIRYVEQTDLNGTAGALWSAREYLKDQFLVLMGDDIYGRQALADLAATPWSLLGVRSGDVIGVAKLETDGEGRVIHIVERQEHAGGPGIINAGAYMLDTRIFDLPMTLATKGSNEYGLPQTIVASGIPPKLVIGDIWLQVNAPEDIGKAEEVLAR